MRPGLGAVAAKAKRRASWFVRDRFAGRRVIRDVQGVSLVLPWSHRLPDYARAGSIYGQNLVELARLLAEAAPPLTVLDIGANVGDSAVQILNAAEGTALCVEGDAAYLEYLHINTDSDARITVVEALLAVEGQDNPSTAVRAGGTTRFVQGRAADAMPSITASALRERFPSFNDLRLVKSDTDGYDVALVPAVAEVWRESRPVLFFEYDPYLTRLAGFEPLDVWPRLDALGYRDLAVWDHGGSPVGRTTIADIGNLAAALDRFPRRRPGSRTYWDIAAVHGSDSAGRGAIEILVPGERWNA